MLSPLLPQLETWSNPAAEPAEVLCQPFAIVGGLIWNNSPTPASAPPEGADVSRSSVAASTSENAAYTSSMVRAANGDLAIGGPS